MGWILLFVLVVRLPFLDLAIQGDDLYYLEGAQHAQIEPLHPSNVRYLFLGDRVDMRGHPHPPLNSWILGGLLFVLGDVHQVPFHAAYLLLSILGAVGVWGLARRFCSRPIAATLLCLSTPAFLINGTTLEADLPLFAFSLSGLALWVAGVDQRRLPLLLAASGLLTAACFSGYQAIAFLGVPALYLLLYRRTWWTGWLLCGLPALLLASWQIFERFTTGAVPLAVLSGHFSTYALQTLPAKARNAVGLTVHLGWVLFPPLLWWAFRLGRLWLALVGIATVAAAFLLDPSPLFWIPFGSGLGVIVWLLRALWQNRRNKEEVFLLAWPLLFFAASLALFFAGSARYLLPLVPAIAVLAGQRAGHTSWLWAGVVANTALGLALATANAQHWNGYRDFAFDHAQQVRDHRVWINGEWGLRFYLESLGALPLERGQPVQPGELIAESALGFPIPFTTGGGVLAPLAQREITPAVPLRLIGLHSRSGYSTTNFGYRAFDISRTPADRVTLQAVTAQPPTLSFLPMGSPESEHQIVSGFFEIEEGAWRWMTGKGTLLLKPPPSPAPLILDIYVPDQAPATRLEVFAYGALVLEMNLRKGPHRFDTESVSPHGESVPVVVTVDRTFAPPGDHRQLGIVVNALGFAAPLE